MLLTPVSPDVVHDMRLDLTCDQHGMKLQVLKAVLNELSVNFSTLLTSSGRCTSVESPLYISITLTHENHTQCGTEVKVNGTHLIYSNELSTEFISQRPETPRDSISRSANIRISFSCVYHYDRVVSLPYPLLTSSSLVTFMVKEGEFNVSMTLHPSAQFLDPYDYPPIIPLTGKLYVQLQIIGHDPQDFFTLRLDECWATPGSNHDDQIRHLIISSGLANDSTVTMLESGNESVSRFSLQMFHFVKFPEFYLHCRVWLYQANDSDCPDPPKTSNSRHIRDLSDPYRKVVSCGPIRMSRSSVSSIGKPELGLSPFIFPASSAAAAILLLGVVTIAKVVKKRAKRSAPPLMCTLTP
ncbi:pancreatic secretory granule membrane major glycoprotein GP2-like isoform X2 [Pyxicephalus adspersus]|uniref:pancreatic secretory granule membrane major glycoprotein GP2-like isoform X2 n=1 Tax=Pyxicephalus adspersus TaxID=30357 RepID=UPI003B5AD72B